MRETRMLAAVLVLIAGCTPPEQPEIEQAVLADPPESSITRELVEQAYVWGLPIVAMYRYYESMGPKVGGLNQVAHNRKLSEPGQFTGGPNRDGVYSFGWFDLNDEPIVVSLPDFGDRYFVWQMTDMYANNFQNVGSHLRD